LRIRINNLKNNKSRNNYKKKLFDNEVESLEKQAELQPNKQNKGRKKLLFVVLFFFFTFDFLFETGMFGPVIALVCANSGGNFGDHSLRSAATLALCKLMLTSADFW
jgi:hypothetical protein